MATVQTLKDKNNDTFYPVTKTEAVYNADGSETLDTTIDNFSNVAQNLSDTKATISTSVSDANKMMKADGTKALVGSDNIDFTTLSRSGAVTHMGSSNVTIDTTGISLCNVNFNSHSGNILVNANAVIANFSGANYEAYLAAYIDGAATAYYMAGVTGTNMTSGTTTISGCRILDVTPGSHNIIVKLFMSNGTCIVPAYTRSSYSMIEV